MARRLAATLPPPRRRPPPPFPVRGPPHPTTALPPPRSASPRSPGALPGCSRLPNSRHPVCSICSSAQETDMVATATRKLLSSLDPRRAQDLFVEMLAKADIQVGGSRPWDLQVHDERIWTRLLRDGTLGAGESYVDGWWDAPALDQFIDHILRARFDETLRENWTLVAQAVRARVLNLQSITRSFDNGQHHYDIGNDLYEAMLGGRLLYTCAYWHNAATLDEAQDAKLDLVCRKVGLRAGMRVLHLGCG